MINKIVIIAHMNINVPRDLEIEFESIKNKQLNTERITTSLCSNINKILKIIKRLSELNNCKLYIK